MVKFYKRKKQTPPPAKRAEIHALDGSAPVGFPSVKAAKRALASIVQRLKPKQSVDEPKKFWLVK